MNPSPETGAHAREVAAGRRFEFGKNWRAFLGSLDEARILRAEASLKAMLEVETLAGGKFLDIGSGSGLFSLAARRLGAEVVSFDFDPASVACGRELRERYFRDDPAWTVSEGSALDEAFLRTLGTFDTVYSWGVLHHTGAMWTALDLAAKRVAPGGRLFIALYNDQGPRSVLWKRVKEVYCGAPRALKPVVAAAASLVLWGPRTVYDCLRLQPFVTWRRYHHERGMSPWRDVVDWVGGYPFEVAKPEEVFEFFKARGFVLRKLRTVGGALGNNEFVFESVSRS